MMEVKSGLSSLKRRDKKKSSRITEACECHEMVEPESIYCIYSREKERKGFSEIISVASRENTCVNHWDERVDAIEFDPFTATPLERVLPQKTVYEEQ